MSFDQDALIRSVGIGGRDKYMMLLGAGASASSGIPTGQQCIWEWKRDIFLSANKEIPPALLNDVSLPNVRQRIQTWLDHQRRFPELGSPEEYGFYIEHAYPKTDDRRAYFAKRSAHCIPQVGYQVLALLQNAFRIKWVWTTNFDGLVRQARKPTHTRTLIEAGMDTATRFDGHYDDPDLSYLVYLHGDYRYDSLRNTNRETQELDGQLRKQLIEQAVRRPIMILGYSGRDESVMDSLREAIKQPSQGGGLYWCALHSEHVSPSVQKLLEEARSQGYESHLVRIDGFDDFTLRLGRYIFREGIESQEIAQLFTSQSPERIPFSLAGYNPQEDWIKSNGHRIELPREIYQCELAKVSSWKELRQLIGDAPLVAGLFGGKAFIFGELSEIERVFTGHLSSKVQRIPIGEQDLASTHTVTAALCLEALTKALSKRASLNLDARGLLWDPTSFQWATAGGAKLKAHPAVYLKLNRSGNDHFINIIPSLHVTTESNQPASIDQSKEVRRDILGKQWNSKYYDELERWNARLFGPEPSIGIAFPHGTVGGFAFRVIQPAASARIFSPPSGQVVSFKRKKGELFDATVLNEPRLVFGTINGNVSASDTHPIRGLVKDGPYDLHFARTGLQNEIRLGVICPVSDQHTLSSYLTKLLNPYQNIETKAEYLQSYPGFQQAYRTPLRVPHPGEPEWRALPSIDFTGSDRVQGQRRLTDAISREVDALTTITSVDVVIIYVPNSWDSYNVVESDQSTLDLHDFVKAYCAQKGVRTQLLRQGTLVKRHQCEVLWWLAQATYAKSLRVPYLLSSNNPNVVFVGIGYGFNKARREGGVVLGCSHVYDAAGQGLRYQLGRIKNPIWRNKNPFLSKDDALRVSLQTRQLFYDTYQRLPDRVVFHKRTPFTRDEREGLAQGLKDVRDLDMLTIEYEDAWRFISYDKYKRSVDGFPVKRGTIMTLDQYSFLLWIHGNTRGVVEGNRSYYQGKSRIPTPVRVTRFSGHAPIEQVAEEILGLSKMDWNSYDLYSQMPVTLETSGEIARIGQLLSRFDQETYDYRLFM